MAQFVITVNDRVHFPSLRTAISQLKGVERVVLLHEEKTSESKTARELYWELQERADSLSQLIDGWDGADSKAIAPKTIHKFKSAIAKAKEEELQDWILFPDARGYLYFDYTGNNAIAGITMTESQLIYFYKKDGQTILNDKASFTSRNFLSILARIHD
ncbi:MAG: hypothetical protein IJP70_00410 [Bacteroidales bacterium]|nr:hypothetical protein [Bacteroidales bacterium]